MFSRRDFNALAQELGYAFRDLKASEHCRGTIIDAVANACTQSNPNFNKTRFADAVEQTFNKKEY